MTKYTTFKFRIMSFIIFFYWSTNNEIAIFYFNQVNDEISMLSVTFANASDLTVLLYSKEDLQGFLSFL